MIQKNAFPLRIGAIMVDLDGTMLDTIRDLTAAVNLTFEKLGYPQLDEALVRNFVGKGIPHLLRRSLTVALGSDPDDALFERTLPVYMDCYEQVNGLYTTLYPGVLEGLDEFKSAGFPLACITNKWQRFTLPLLQKTGLKDYFAVLVAGDTLPKRKPDPLPLTYACEQLKVPPGEMLMIGDSINDVQAARAAGCPVFCVPYGYNEGTDVRALNVDAIVETLPQAAKLIIKS